jgi:hypothetical protein
MIAVRGCNAMMASSSGLQGPQKLEGWCIEQSDDDCVDPQPGRDDQIAQIRRPARCSHKREAELATAAIVSQIQVSA